MINSNDDFGFTISGNPVSATRVKEIHGRVEKLHKKRATDALKTDPSSFEQADIA